MSTTYYLAIAFTILWLIPTAYIFVINSKLKKLQKLLADTTSQVSDEH